jgi:peptide-methionine (R)-S-oxide reductase
MRKGLQPCSPAFIGVRIACHLAKTYVSVHRRYGMDGGKVIKSDLEWRQLLTPEQFRVTRQQGTERAFTGPYWDSHQRGLYSCVCCGLPLFRSDAKFDSGCGWPSFFEPVSPDALHRVLDLSEGLRRTAIRCARCDAHLGHVFRDGPAPTGLRFSINGHAMSFIPESA